MKPWFSHRLTHIKRFNLFSYKHICNQMTNDISQALGCKGCHFSVWLVCLGFVWMLKVTKFSWKMATWKPNEVRAKRSSEDRPSKWASDTSITNTTHEVICVYSTHQSSPSAQPYKSARPQELQCFDVVSEAFVYWLSLMWSTLWVVKKMLIVWIWCHKLK